MKQFFALGIAPYLAIASAATLWEALRLLGNGWLPQNVCPLRFLVSPVTAALALRRQRSQLAKYLIFVASTWALAALGYAFFGAWGSPAAIAAGYVLYTLKRAAQRAEP